MASYDILVVDNSPVIRKIVSSVLEAEGHRVAEASDGLEALDRIVELKPDIVFTDLVMPKIDGNKLSYIIRNTPELQETFLVVLSGVALEDDSNVIDLGADVCIAKGPGVSMKQHVLGALNRFTEGRRGGSSIEGLEGLYPREVTRELLTSKRHRDIILAEMTEGVVELDSEGRIVMINSAAIRLFELDETRILGLPLHELLPEREATHVREWVDGLASSSKRTLLSYTYDTPILLGQRQLTLNLLPVTEQEQYFMIGIFRDVTGRKNMEARQRQLERELVRIQKLDAMSLMASGIAHDFNNLLTIINGNVEMARFITREEKVEVLLGESIKALELTTQLIRQFTTFSDNYLPQKSKVDLEMLIRDVLARELDGTEIEFHVTMDKAALPVRLDSSLVIQVFRNLVRNSLAAMGRTGNIGVHVDQVEGGAEALRTGQPVPEGKLVRIRFHDTGTGIPGELLDRVFDPYFSTKQKGAQKGMGLGLTIVHSIVKKHGGMVWIESRPEAGCTVWLYFPEAVKAIIDPLHKQETKKRKRVLVMDDEEMMRIINRKMFSHFGCDVETAVHGEEAVALYEAAKGENRGFDLVLLDLNISDGMDGKVAARKIHEIDPEACLVAVSGDGDSDILLHYAKNNFVAAMAKPFSLDTVEDLVRRFLAE